MIASRCMWQQYNEQKLDAADDDGPKVNGVIMAWCRDLAACVPLPNSHSHPHDRPQRRRQLFLLFDFIVSRFIFHIASTPPLVSTSVRATRYLHRTAATAYPQLQKRKNKSPSVSRRTRRSLCST